MPTRLIPNTFLAGTENAKRWPGGIPIAYAVKGVEMVSASIVIDAYDDARARGLSRAESFLRAVNAFSAGRPELSTGEAGTEVARILLQAAAVSRAAQDRCSVRDAMPRPAISW